MGFAGYLFFDNYGFQTPEIWLQAMPVVITSGIFILPVMYVEHVVFSVIIYIFNGLSSGFLDQEICSLWGFDCQYIKFGGF